jgi:hypothetical protein
VYEYPSISQLASFVFGIVSGQPEKEASVGTKSSARLEMVSNHIQSFPTHTGERQLPTTTEKVVLLTGTTGQLGCHLLSLLVTDDSVVQVYAVNRSSPQQTGLRERHANALLQRGLDVRILDSPKLLLLAGNISNPGFDLPVAVYRRVSRVLNIFVFSIPTLNTDARGRHRYNPHR